MIKYSTLFFLVLFPVFVQGQEIKLPETVISIAEELAADNSDPEAAGTYIEKLSELAENPVKINSSDVDEISRLFFLSDFQVKSLINYSHSSGRIVSLYELAAIPGFDRETVEMMNPFITLYFAAVNEPDSAKWRNTLISNFSIKPDNNDTAALGSNWKILTKYRFSAGEFSGGLTTEKDPGERSLFMNPAVTDFLSAHLAFRGDGFIKKIIVGDFSARFGQGTNINTGIHRSISLTSQGYMSACDEIKPYTSTEENRYLRGVAAEFSLGNFDFSMFFSKKKRDATVVLMNGFPDGYIENFYMAGLHNTPSLLQKKNAVGESVYGINLSCNINDLKIGLIWSENTFSIPVNLTDNDPVNEFGFTGERNDLYTLYYNGFIKNILLYGELSANGKNKLAAIQGLSLRPSDRLTINILLRKYNAGYTAFYGNGPGYGSKNSNEQGILGNFAFEAAKHLFISGGIDIQNYPWLKYRCSGPTRGIRRELAAKYLPTEKLTFDASFNYHLSMSDNVEDEGIPEQKEIITRSIKGSFRFLLSDNLTFGSRIDFKVADPSGSKGVLLLQDITYKFRKYPVTLWFRHCLFNTDTWDSRLYTYENDLLYSFSIPALSGQGSRSYIMIKWDAAKFAELRIKYGITSSRTNSNSIKNTNEIKMQFRIWF